MSPSSFAAHDNHAESSSHVHKTSSGLTFVLPPLSAIKAQKSKKKIKLTYEEPVKKTPRPIKLKPLKEVLSRLIAQIKKKDDYAFFLHPVDPAQVPGYSDLISRPMDLGTMTTKVERGKYRSLEEFASDLRLVTTNAKTFNPPGSIYHTEADRIEAFGLEHIAKAASTVIEYETDWNIEIEKDEDPVNVDDDDGSGAVGTPAEKAAGMPMDVDESRAGSPYPVQVGGKRLKGKKLPGPLTESIEPDGGLPGAKDGLAAFPPGSDWAELMLALKLKGKRYRTKKERMRIEKGGPPYTAEGSIDYWEMEDPFTIFAPLVEEHVPRPALHPLYPSLEPSDPYQEPLPTPVNIFSVENVPEPSTLFASTYASRQSSRTKPPRRRHWTITRNASTRGRARDAQEDESAPAWNQPREPVASDFGTFATLPSLLAEEMGMKDVSADLGSEEKLFNVLRRTCQSHDSEPNRGQPSIESEPDESYWGGNAARAEGYIRDLVYGGVEGFAYVRSLAEFLTPTELPEQGGNPPAYGELGMPVARWVEENIVNPLTDGRHAILCEAAQILRELPSTPFSESSSPAASIAIPIPTASPADPILHQIELSLFAYPAADRALKALQSIASAQIDLPALIHAPDELFRAEDVWAGREYREKRRKEMDEALALNPEKNAAAYLQWAIEEHREAEAGAGMGGKVPSGMASGVGEDAGMLAYALEYAADEIVRLARGERAGPNGVQKFEDKPEPDEDVVMKTEDDTPAAPTSTLAPTTAGNETNGNGNGAHGADEPGGEGEEDPELRKLRLNLLALAKRAPLDQIMKLPPELVPAHLRHIVPTADS
ncbi:hypothetical protein BC628DRAFT_1379256 [Trametes gibbosa]|nr:hypothetical protein BC628DRAFT_1379256 [Trametes gibbosa]